MPSTNKGTFLGGILRIAGKKGQNLMKALCKRTFRLVPQDNNKFTVLEDD
jgi:hypothetical protein